MQRIAPYKTLDIFRGYAALWVVMVHSCDRWLGGVDPKYSRVPLYAFSLRGQLGVMIFFAISGYCITAAAYGALVTRKSIWRYSYERIRRIYPPYLVTVVLTVISLAAIGVANAHHWIPPVNHPHVLQPDPRFWIGNLLLLQMELNTPMLNVVFWSLCYEIAFYLIIGIFIVGAQALAAKRGLTAGAYVLVNAFGISTALGLIWLIFDRSSDPSHIFPMDLWHQFALGGLLFFLLEWKPETVQGFTKSLRWTVIANFAVAVALTMVYIAMKHTGGEDDGHPSNQLRSLTCLIFLAILIVLRKYDDKVSENVVLRPLMWIGAFSYSLYLIHPIILPYLDILCRKVGLNGPLYWIAFWIQVGVSVVAGRIFFLLVERWFISKRQVQRLVAEHVSLAAEPVS